MTAKEQKTIDELYSLLSEIIIMNNDFRNKVEESISQINNKVEKKFLPVSLEQDILQTIQQSIHETVIKSLTGYNSPLFKLIDEIISVHNQELKDIINNAFEDIIRTEEFKEGLREAFSHKVARTIVTNQEGLFDKVSNELKQNIQFKSKITLAIANVVNECAKGVRN